MMEQQEYLITPSLLNSWGYMWECDKYVRESVKDEISLEDKQVLAREKAKADFLNVLNRIPTPQNEYMLRGIQFEDDCYKGLTPISPIIKNGAYQIVGMKHVIINGMPILMYGRLDVLKGGIIYDIKRITMYILPKYKTSYQHKFYMELFPNAYKFTYLAYDDNNKLHLETYYPDECQSIEKSVIPIFLNWLKQNNLLEVYQEKWRSKNK